MSRLYILQSHKMVLRWVCCILLRGVNKVINCPSLQLLCLLYTCIFILLTTCCGNCVSYLLWACNMGGVLLLLLLLESPEDGYQLAATCCE
jgi:hypothetical protein